MEIISFLTFLIVFVILIVVINYNSGLNIKIEKLIREINLLKNSLQKFEGKFIAQPGPPVIIPEKKFPDKVSSVEMASETSYNKSITVERKVTPEEPSKAEPIMVKQSIIQPQPIARRLPEPKKNKEHTDFEKFIGENLISKLGILILIAGVGFFVKYAIDQNWINENGRTAIGMLIGILLIGVAHYLRKSYKTFSSLLTGGGIAVFYLTISIAYHQYQLFTPAETFVILIVITIFSVILSLVYDKKELAIFSQIGGYAAPFMVSTGGDNYIVLFTYMLILNSGLIVLSYFKRWHVLNLLAFAFTVIIFSTWLGTTFWNKNNPPHIGAFIFASLFYLVFFLVNTLNNLKERKPFNGIEIAMVLSNNLFYFLSGLSILHNFQEGIFKGLFTVMIGLYNFAWVLYLYRKQQIDRNFIFLLIGLVMSFVSIAIPIQLNGHSITLFWTAEFVILLWLSQRSGIKLLKTGHLVVVTLAMISLIMDWIKLYGQHIESMPIIFNQMFVTGAVVLTGLVLTIYFLRKDTEEYFITYFISVKSFKTIVVFLLFIVAYFFPYLELQYQMNNFYGSISLRHIVYGIYNFAYLLAMLLVLKRFKWSLAFKWFISISLVSLLIYVVYYQYMVSEIRDSFFYSHSVTFGNFLFHYLFYPFIFGIIYLIFSERNKVFTINGFISRATLWYLAFFTIFIASAELDNILLITMYTNNESIYSVLRMSHKVGYPILWSIATFIFIVWGIRTKIKDYRIIALSLLALIILKLFVDVWYMSKGGQITAFIFLGVIMLVISFLYQKLKRLISEDNSTKPTIENQ